MPQVLRWAGRDADDCQRVRGRLADLVDGVHPDRFGAVTHPWQDGTVREAVVADTPAQAATALRAGRVLRGGRGRPLAVLFAGQGAQRPLMATGLYGREPTFTEVLDTVFELLGDGRLRDVWLTPDADVDGVAIAQPLLFAVGYALARMLLDWTVAPVALLGHSVGETVAATVAGVFELPDAVALLADRVERIAVAPDGGMLAVRASVAELTPLLTEDVVVAAVNAPRQTLLAGPTGPLAAVRDAVSAAGLLCMPAKATSPFHSPALIPACADSLAAYRGVWLRQPTIPVYSAYLGTPLPPATAVDPAFWAGQPAAPVLFWPTLDTLLAQRPVLLVEAGPGQSLSGLARTHPAVTSGHSDVTSMLPARRHSAADDVRAALTAAARIWVEGHDVAWRRVDRLGAANTMAFG